MESSGSSVKRSRARDANDALIRNFPRVFFGLAFSLAFFMFYTYMTGGGGKLPSGPVPGTRVIPLAPRQGHSHGGSGDHSAHGDSHSHSSESEKKIADTSSSSSLSSGLVEPAPRRVERRTMLVEGREIIEETTYYGMASELSSSELESLGAAAIDAAKTGSEIVVVRKKTKSKRKKPKAQAAVEGKTTPEGEGKSSSTGSSTGTDEVTGQSVDTVENINTNVDSSNGADKEISTQPSEVLKSTPATEEWVDLVIPGRDPSWPLVQRPIPGEKESVTSHVFEEATQHSNNPPVVDVNDKHLVTELSHRLVIAIALGVHSGQAQIASSSDLNKLPVLSVLLSSFLPTAQPNHLYRFYFAYDHNDRIYEKQEYRDRISQIYAESFKEEDGKRWHPAGYTYDGPVDSSRLLFSVHWVHCDFASKPSWAHTDAVMAAYKEGADYAYRTNDDTKFPEVKYWADLWILNLRSRKPLPNVGVVGPACGEGATWILTHDFTHKTHVVIFGFQYPRSLPNWSSDDWITFVYDGFKMMHKEESTVVGHTFALGTRYNPSSQTERLAALNQALQDGSIVLSEWLKKEKGVDLPYTVKSVSCC